VVVSIRGRVGERRMLPVDAVIDDANDDVFTTTGRKTGIAVP
jgi:hypothetical protein